VREDIAYGFGLGVIVGILIAATVNSMSWTYAGKASTALLDCESTMPRNEECIITAVPAGKGGEQP